MVGRLKKKKKMEKIAGLPISVYTSTGVLGLVYECCWVQTHSSATVRYLKGLKRSVRERASFLFVRRPKEVPFITR